MIAASALRVRTKCASPGVGMTPIKVTFTPTLVSPAINACSISSPDLRVSLPIKICACSWKTMPVATPISLTKFGFKRESAEPALPRIPSVPKRAT